MNPSLKIGLFGIGLETYWNQFEGLKERLEGFLQVVENKRKEYHPEILNLGLIDSNEKAFEEGIKFKEEGGWHTSPQFLKRNC